MTVKYHNIFLEADAEMYEFKKEYEIGIEDIDAEHRKFFDYIKLAVDAMDLPEAEALQRTRELLDKLIIYAASHFEHEERYMEEHDDPELPVQRRAHGDFTSKVAELSARKDGLRLKDLGEIFIFMAKWLSGHILTLDKMIGKSSGDGKFVMTSDFLTGIDFVDREHTKLFEIIGRVHGTIDDESLHDSFDAIMDILGELRDYTIKHFADEERYMESIKYDGLEAQKTVHELFIDKVTEIDIQELSDKNNDDQREYLQSLVAFLNDWLVSHIKNMDKKIPVRADGARPSEG